MKALTVCNEPGCGNEVVSGRCQEHERERRAARPREPYYSTPRWRAIRKQYLERHPVCEEPSCGAKATEVHHIDGVVTHDSYRNLKALCKPCHSRITLHPLQVSDTMKRPHSVITTPRGPQAREPVIGGGLLEEMMRRKAAAATAGDAADLGMDEGWPDVSRPAG